jgi:hypothetical protein
MPYTTLALVKAVIVRDERHLTFSHSILAGIAFVIVANGIVEGVTCWGNYLFHYFSVSHFVLPFFRLLVLS